MKLFQRKLDSCTPCPNKRTDANVTRHYCGKTGKDLCWIGQKEESKYDPWDYEYHDVPYVEDNIPIPSNCPLPDVEEKE